MERLKGIENLIVKAEEFVIFLSITALIVMLFLQVVFRFALEAPLAFTEEAARLLFTWLIFIGAARALYVSQHFMVDIVYNHVPAKVRNIAGLLSDLVTIIFALLLAWSGYGLAAQGTQMLPVLGLPVWAQNVAFPVGMLLLAFHACCIVLQREHVGDGQHPDFEE